MHRTGTITNDSHGWPLEGGGGTVCLIPIAWAVEACRFAGGGAAAVVSSLTLDRERTASAKSKACFSRPFEGGEAVLVSSLTLDREGTVSANSANTVYKIAGVPAIRTHNGAQT